MSSGVNARRVRATVAIMSMVGLVLVVAAAVLYLFLAFVVRRTYPTWLFDVAVGIGAAVSVVAWVTGGSGAVTLLTVAFATAWFVLTFFTLPMFVAWATPFSYREVMRDARTAMVTAFALGTVLVVLPMIAERCKALLETL